MLCGRQERSTLLKVTVSSPCTSKSAWIDNQRSAHEGSSIELHQHVSKPQSNTTDSVWGHRLALMWSGATNHRTSTSQSKNLPEVQGQNTLGDDILGGGGGLYCPLSMGLPGSRGKGRGVRPFSGCSSCSPDPDLSHTHRAAPPPSPHRQCAPRCQATDVITRSCWARHNYT